MPTYKLGQEYNVYGSTSAPTVATNSTYYDAVAAVKALAITGERGEVEIANFDAGFDRDFLATSRTRSISGTMDFDLAVDTGQDAVLDAFDSDSGALYVLITTGTSSQPEYYGQIVVLGFTKTINQDETITVQFNGRWTDYTRGVTA